MTNDLVLSTSSVSEYLRCHHRYFLSHVYRMKGGRQTVAAAVGQAVHSGVEALLKPLPVRPLEALKRSYAHEMASVPRADIAADPDGLRDAVKMLAVYEQKVVPAFHPTLVEVPFVVRVEGIILSGTIDAADEDVRDLKTTAGKTINGRKPRFDPSNYDLQLTFYRFGYKALTGNWPKRLLLDVLTRRGTYRQYEREPKVGDAIDTLGVVKQGIMRAEFDPNGALSGSCFYCPFIEVCDYAVRD